MDQSVKYKRRKDKFLRLHAECTSALETYTGEAEILCRMLAACNGDTNVTEQIDLITQRRQESAAYGEYVRARKRLLRAAHLNSDPKSTVRGLMLD